MTNKAIDVFISEDGTVVLSPTGFSGPECLAATQELEALLGGPVVSRQDKPEMQQGQPASAPQQVEVRQ